MINYGNNYCTGYQFAGMWEFEKSLDDFIIYAFESLNVTKLKMKLDSIYFY